MHLKNKYYFDLTKTLHPMESALILYIRYMHFYYNLNANIDENGANDHNVKDSMDKGNIEERE
jgi:hypothetical protein